MAQRFAMKLMRHSDIKLTAKVYTDEAQLPVYESIKNLPRLGGYTQIRAQISGQQEQNVTQADAASEGVETQKSVDFTPVCPVLALPAAEIKMERAKGFEPSKQIPA